MANDTKVVYDKEMKSIKFGPNSDTYEVVDDRARTDLAKVTRQVETLTEEVGEVPTTYATKTELETGLNNKQDTLISGTNIKTINSQSLLGEGNIEVGGSYTLPVASADELGGIKVGPGLTINSNGVLSANGGSYTLPIASSTTLGGIKVGANLSITEGGTLNAEAGASIPVFKTTKEILSKSWNDILLAGAGNTQTFGFAFHYSPTELLIDSSKGWSITAGDISINMTSDTVSVTVGSTTENIYENGKYLAKEISDASATLKADFSTGNTLVFRNKDTNEAVSFPMSIVSVDNLRNMTDKFLYVGGFSQGISEYRSYSGVSTDIYGLQADVTSPENLLSDTSQTYTIQGEYFSLLVSATEIKLTVAGQEFYLYTAGNWTDQTYINLADDKNDFRATVDIWGGGASTTGFSITFRYSLDKSVLTTQSITSSTGTEYISGSLLFGIAIENNPNGYNLENIVGFSGTPLYKVQFDTNYANNVNRQITINDTNKGLQIAPTYATAYFEGRGANIYENGAWVASNTFSNGCIWDLDTHILTFPNKDNNIFLNPNQNYLNDVGNGISFIDETIAPPSLPEASAYQDKMAVINDEQNNIILTVVSDGSKWSFVEDVVKMSWSLKDQIRQNNGQLYGVSFVGKYAITEGVYPITLNELIYNEWASLYSWESMGLQKQLATTEYSNSTTSILPEEFATAYLPISAENTQITIDVSYIHNSDLTIDVGDNVPTVTFVTALSTLFKQNGTRVASLDFSTTNTLYKLTFNSYSNYLLVECETFSKSI